MSLVTAPIGATPLWIQVTDRAGHRCQCAGECGRRHRCPTERGALFVAPADLSVPATEAWRVPSTDLRAWCSHCLDAGRRLSAHPHGAAPAPTLFDVKEAS